MRMMVVFEKGYLLRHIGHLDLMRTLQRALRRSGLPLQYSQGFNPHIQLSFAAPLSVGVVGLREVMDVPLAQEISPEVFQEMLNKTLPGGMKVVTARAVADDFPTLMALVAASKMSIVLHNAQTAPKILEALSLFLEKDDVQMLRKTKSGENMCNIRPFVMDAKASVAQGEVKIECMLNNTPAGALKPSLLMSALCKLAELDSVEYTAYREEILCRNAKGALVPMVDYERG